VEAVRRSSIALSRSGRWAVLPANDGLELVDLLGTAARRQLAATGEVCFVGSELWVLDRARLERLSPDTLEHVAPPIQLDNSPRTIVPGYSATACSAVAIGETSLRLAVVAGRLVVERLSLAWPEPVVAVSGHRVFAYGANVLRALDRRGEAWRTKKVTGEVLAASVVLGGRAIVVLSRGADADACRVLRATGELIHSLDVPKVERWAVAEELGHAFAIGVDGQLSRVDLRYGRVIGTVAPPIAVHEVAVDQDGRHLLLVGANAADGEVLHLVVSGLFHAHVDEAADALSPESVRRPHLVRDDAAAGEAPADSVA